MKILLAFFALAAMALTARSDIVWSWQTPLGLRDNGFHTQAQVWFGNSSGPYNLFDTVWFSAADVGHTFRITSSADDGDFPTAVLSLTDGTNNQIMIMEGTGNMGGWTYGESDLFANVPRTGPDLIGYQINAIDLTIDQFSISYNPTFNWTDFSGIATLSIEGSIVPEPSITSLVGIGLGLFGVLRLVGQGQREKNADSKQDER